MTLRDLDNCKQKNRKSQQVMYLHFVDRLYNVAVRYCKDMHEAKDVLQDSFIKIFDKLNQFEGDLIQLEKWMIRIVINTALANYRKQSRFLFNEEVMSQLEQSISPGVSDAMEYQDFKVLIERLPDDLRITFNLSFIEGYKHKEIGQLLGIKESSSRTRLTRAKKILRELFTISKMVEYV